MMKALIHIGMPKSGTSSIQAFLQQNRERISDQGLLYRRFEAGLGSQFEFAVIALSACGAEIQPQFERKILGLNTLAAQQDYSVRYAAFLDATLAEEAAHSCFVGSSEHIYAWLNSVEQIAALDQFLCARFSDVRYLLYLRNQQDHVLSSYSEAIRRGHSHSLDQHLERQGLVNHALRVDRWIKGVGRERLSLRIYAPDRLRNGDLLSDFCHQAGIVDTGLQRPGRENAALSAEEIRVRRVLNRLLPLQGADGRPHRIYLWALSMLKPLMRHRTKLGLSAAQRAKVEALNAKGNERLRRRFFPKRPGLF